MKKLLVLFMVITLFTTGCFLTAESKIASAASKMNSAKNMTMNMEMLIEGTNEDGDAQKVNIEASILTDNETNISNTKMKMSALGMSFDIESYAKEEGNQTTTYSTSPFSSGWTKTTVETTTNEEVDPTEIANIAKEAIEIKELTPTEKGTEKFELLVEPDKMEELLDSVNGTTSQDKEDYNLTEPLKIIITLKDGYFYDFSLNMLDYMTEDAKKDVDKAQLYIKFTDFNKTEVSIPSTVINTAKEAAE